ncbi:MAG: hypothetical protein FJ008_05575 [Chloroflexi bacterium]|nr:hypothetical protein [Chloroflexota bacterium]MBM3154789.1 hypothetical protein [Chloroflexota bacterium]MBM3175222.1 hypothetical protein [Chloroflexota bacterium]MBM4450660.1 hypothetical protein [Chloroflexota bacterium]
MTKRAVLVLEDGAIYEGYSFGAGTTTYGEVVFDTAMAGYGSGGLEGISLGWPDF